MRDERTYIRVHDGMPDHPKVESLSDKAFRLLVVHWCWCSRYLTNGQIPRAKWDKEGTPKARRELLAAGLAKECGEQVRMHDYLQHQRSAGEVEEKRAVRRRAAMLGNHQRWHVAKNVYDPKCEVCVEASPPEPPPSDEDDPPIGSGSQKRSQTESGRDRKKSPEVRDRDREGSTQPGKARYETNARELATTAHTPHAGRLVDDYADTCRQRPPARVRAKLGAAVQELLDEHWSDELITAALHRWGAKGLDASVLVSVANEVANGDPNRGRRPANGDMAARSVLDQHLRPEPGDMHQLPPAVGGHQ